VLSAELIEEYICFAQRYQDAQSSADNDAAIHYPIVDHQRNKKNSLWLLCDLAEITGDNAKFDKNSIHYPHIQDKLCTNS
jgi:hypothetical protein